MQIGKTVKQIRIDKNLKQSAVAAAIGMSVTAYSNIGSADYVKGMHIDDKIAFHFY